MEEPRLMHTSLGAGRRESISRSARDGTGCGGAPTEEDCRRKEIRGDGLFSSPTHQRARPQGRKACSEGQFDDDDDDDVKGSMRYNHRHVLVVLTTAV